MFYSLYLNKSKKWTGFADDNGFPTFVETKVGRAAGWWRNWIKQDKTPPR